MDGLYLSINAGSSSLKFTLYRMPEKLEIVNGLMERIGKLNSSYTLKFNGEKIEKEKFIKNHDAAVNTMLKLLKEYNFIKSINDIEGVGHRILHGGEIYSDSVLITEDVIKNLEELTKLGPLHLPGEIDGIKAVMNYMPYNQVAVFDTAFHQTMPEENYRYSVPDEWYKKYGVRKYGFHGTSCKYVTKRMQEILGKENVNLIICHLGSGASITAIKNGLSYDNSMGLTPLDGVMMGTRSGSIDPSIIEYISKEKDIDIEDIIKSLNEESGLKGITNKNDFRDIVELAKNGNTKAKLAIAKFEKSVIRYISEYVFELEGKIDAIVFTAGIGENAIELRENIVDCLDEVLNVKLDKNKNDNIAKFKEQKEGKISTDDSKIGLYVIPTNEELMIAEDAYNICNYQRVMEKVI